MGYHRPSSDLNFTQAFVPLFANYIRCPGCLELIVDARVTYIMPHEGATTWDVYLMNPIAHVLLAGHCIKVRALFAPVFEESARRMGQEVIVLYDGAHE